ncbi:hypothetical protein QBC40DRAFT_16838 [Triangularia verruculosa]|uniref:Zn(2)-C6 fungal-type domain-containing protein n=1 Tax=Triangularia verruculosa TaxID=2587418 RepID=A0AAN7B083_9PEZI|nr:hypothetical protein QBC40DRAFT_16838 [Triangularia verruculosa]
MADTLKRTFHGCLTCRKRKVRCLGGNPCQNCSRMNITCHSSFDTNLRIRVSTPTGQKLVDNKPQPIRGLRRLPQPPASVAPPLGGTASTAPSTFDGSGNENYVATSFEPHFSSFSLSQPPPPAASYASSVPSIHHQFTTAAQSVSLPSFDNSLYTSTWNSSFDFSCIDPSLDPGRFDNGFNNGASTSMMASPMSYGDMMPGLSSFTGAGMPSLLSENDFSAFPAQEGTKEWVPKRRRRTKKAASREPEPEVEFDSSSRLHEPLKGGNNSGGWSYHSSRSQPYHSV